MAMKITNFCPDYKGEKSSVTLMSDSSRSIISVGHLNIVYESDSKIVNERKLKDHAIQLLQEAIVALS